MAREMARSRNICLPPLLACCIGSVVVGGACSQPSIPAHPTWADVEPILHGECTGCHGVTAPITGGGYRLDFYDMTPESCGEAALAVSPGAILAATAAPTIGTSIAPPATGGRARMPPAPGSELAEWQQDILQRWVAQPVKGAAPPGNRPPTIDVGQLPAEVKDRLTFSAVISDPDGLSAVGVIRIADVLFAMNRSGSFKVDIDTSAWPAGTMRLSAVLCDGWSSSTVDLGPLRIAR
jgi:hypothetical protein